MKALLLLLPIAALSSCASVSSAQQHADYNGDGAISQAESAQFNRQKNVEDRAVYSESTKRRNATNTIRDTSDALYQARRAQSLFKGF